MKEETNKKIDESEKRGDWKELDVGYMRYYREVRNSNGSYTRRYCGVNDDGEHGGEIKEEFVEMAKPRPCAYNSKTDMHGDVIKTVKIKADTTSSSTPPPLDHPVGDSFTLPVRHSGITGRQLRAVLLNLERRCELENWTDKDGNYLTPERVSLYDIDTYIIRPYTRRRKISFVQALPSTAGWQPPQFFISHWWGEPVRDFVFCLEQVIIDFRMNNIDYGDQDARGGGMSADTPVWVCAYANNQWDLDFPNDPRESDFTKAMEVAKGRTITILDKKGEVFNRVWCIFELFLTLEESKDPFWAVYTTQKHEYEIPDYKGDDKEKNGYEKREAVGIVSGGATSDIGDSSCITAREKSFPYDLIKRSLKIKVECADSSYEKDKIHILNSIVGKTGDALDNVPLESHKKYANLNNSLRATFASSTASLQGAAKEGGEGWNDMVTALSKGSMTRMSFDFKPGRVLGELKPVQAKQLVANLPLTIESLKIQNAKYGTDFIDTLVQRVSKLVGLEKFWIDNEPSVDAEEKGKDDVGEDEEQKAGSRLAEMLSTNCTIKELYLYNTNLIGLKNVEIWGDALMQNKTITRLWLIGTGKQVSTELEKKTSERTPELKVGRPIVDQLKAMTKNRSLNLKIRVH